MITTIILVFYVLFSGGVMFNSALEVFNPWHTLSLKNKLFFIGLMLVSSFVFPILLGLYVSTKWEE